MRRALLVLPVLVVVAGACGGDGGSGTSVQRASVGGKPIETKSGQRVQALKILEEPAADSTLGKFILLSGQICNTRSNGFAPSSRFSLELEHKRTVRPDPSLRTGGTPAILSATSGMATPNGGCVDGWDAFAVNASDRVTAVIFTPDVRKPGSNQVRFTLPPRRIPPTTQFPSEASTTTTTTAPPPPTNPPTISLAEFNAIQNGWSLQQVIDTVGGPGELQSTVGDGDQHLEGYKWEGRSLLGPASASVFFRNGLVYDKLQFNLQ